MNPEIVNQFNSEWRCNEHFPYTEVFDRHFKMLDELEKLIPRYHPALWKGNPKDLESFLSREKEARELRSDAVDRLYQDLREEPPLKVTFIDPDNIWGNPVFPSRQPQQEWKINIPQIEEDEQVMKDDGWDRFFRNASPIPHCFNNWNEKMGEDYINGIPLVEESPELLDTPEKNDETTNNENDQLALTSSTTNNKDIKRKQRNKRRKKDYKKKKLEKKLNNAFFTHDKRHSR